MRTIIGLAALARSGKDTVASMLLTYPGVAAYALADPLKLGCQALFGLTEDETWCDDIKEQTIELWGRSPREFFQTVGTEWMRNHNPDHWLIRAEREINPPPAFHSGAATETRSEAEDTPFTLAARAIFDFTHEQLTDPALLNTPDTTWGLTPGEAIDLLKSHAYALYTDYDTRRAQRPVTPLRPRSKIPADATTVIFKDIRFENEAAFLRAHNGQIWHIVRPNLQKVNAHSSEHGIARALGDLLITNDGSLSDLHTAVQNAWQQCNTTQQSNTPNKNKNKE
ncbi:deoxynucleotide monophosphate kinase family protein [Pseudomonas putida]